MNGKVVLEKKNANIFGILYPNLIKEWHPTKNGEKTPFDFTQGSDQVIWWKCLENPKHEWDSRINKRSKGRGCPYCAGKRVLKEESLGSLYPNLLKEWHSERNKKSAFEFACKSNKVAWWMCENGHEWQSKIVQRTEGHGKCSTCASLGFKNPEIAKDWDYYENIDLTPYDVFNGSDRIISWKCHHKECNHKWKSAISTRTQKTSSGKCPACSGKILTDKNMLSKIYPEIALFWDYDKNKGLTPDDVIHNSSEVVCWKCPDKNCSYEWETAICIKTRNKTGCPACAGKAVSDKNRLSLRYPDLVKDWDYDKNDGLTPNDYTYASNQKVHWKCYECNHSWEALIGSRTNKNIQANCPACSGRVVTDKNRLSITHPNIAKQWDYKKNNELTPNDVSYGMGKKVYWTCDRGHSWKAYIYGRTYRDTGCPKCEKSKKTSVPEQIFYFYFKKYFFDTENKYLIEENSLREYDCYIPSIKLAFEYDGYFYHKSQKSVLRDEKKNEIVKEDEILIRVREPKLPKLKEHPRVVIFELKDRKDSSQIMIIREVFNFLMNRFIINKDIRGKIGKETFDIKKDLSMIYEQIEFLEKENSLAVMFPKVAKEWNYEENGKLTPFMVYARTHQKVWWKCSTCNHVWQTSVGNRTKKNNKGTNCPACANKVVTDNNRFSILYPQIALEWDYEKNSGKRPEDFVYGSGKAVWWKCINKECSHEWKDRISKRTQSSSGCRKCAKNIKKVA